MSLVFGYMVLGIICIICMYIFINVLIHHWKTDKMSFIVILVVILALALGITGLMLGGSGYEF